MVSYRDEAYRIASDVKLVVDCSDYRAQRRKSLAATSIVLVEGSDDERIYSKFISKEHCQVWACGGKTVIMHIVGLLEAWQPNLRGYLAITDRDYDSFHQRGVRRNQIKTPGHDLELMILGSPALELLLDDYLQNENQQAVSSFKTAFRKQLFHLGAKIGYIRMVVHEHCRANDIKDYNSLCDRLTWTCLNLLDAAGNLHYRQVQDNLRQRLPNVDAARISKGRLKKTKRRHKIDDLCHGKDMLEIARALFSRMTKLHFGQPYDLRPDLGAQLFDIFSLPHFIGTQLYQDIKSWESANWPCRVLKV